MPQTAHSRQLQKVNAVHKDEVRVPKVVPTWKLAIADAEGQIARLRRSIELFKQYDETGMPFPQSATQN
jgi:hypothetical protein